MSSNRSRSRSRPPPPSWKPPPLPTDSNLEDFRKTLIQNSSEQIAEKQRVNAVEGFPKNIFETQEQQPTVDLYKQEKSIKKEVNEQKDKIKVQENAAKINRDQSEVNIEQKSKNGITDCPIKISEVSKSKDDDHTNGKSSDDSRSHLETQKFQSKAQSHLEKSKEEENEINQGRQMRRFLPSNEMDKPVSWNPRQSIKRNTPKTLKNVEQTKEQNIEQAKDEKDRQPFQNVEQKKEENFRKPFQNVEQEKEENVRKTFQNVEQKKEENVRKPFQKVEQKKEENVRKPFQNTEPNKSESVPKTIKKVEPNKLDETQKPTQKSEPKELESPRKPFSTTEPNKSEHIENKSSVTNGHASEHRNTKVRNGLDQESSKRPSLDELSSALRYRLKDKSFSTDPLGGLTRLDQYLLLASSSCSIRSPRFSELNIKCIVRTSCNDSPEDYIAQDDIETIQVNLNPDKVWNSDELDQQFDKAADAINRIGISGGVSLIQATTEQKPGATNRPRKLRLGAKSESSADSDALAGSLCVAFLMKHRKLPLESALELIKGRRQDMKPSSALTLQLLEYEKGLKGEPKSKYHWKKLCRLASQNWIPMIICILVLTILTKFFIENLIYLASPSDDSNEDNVCI